jgi:hypothetical protein
MSRARRMKRKGEERRAMLALREAVCRANDDARLWTLYGVQCARVGRVEEAERALRHALWLRQRARDERRVEVTRTLLARVCNGAREFRLNAA